MISMTISRLKLIRLLKGLETKEVAERLNISTSYYLQIEDRYVNLKKARSKKLIEGIENLFGFSVPFLLASITREEQEKILALLEKEASNDSLESGMEAFGNDQGRDRGINGDGEAGLGDDRAE